VDEGPDPDSFESLERFVEGRAIVSRLGIFQPDSSQRLVDDRLIRRPLERRAKGDDGGLRVTGTGLSQPDSDLAFDVVAIQAGNDLKLIELVGAPVLRGVEIGQLFARGNEAGGERHARSKARWASTARRRSRRQRPRRYCASGSLSLRRAVLTAAASAASTSPAR
jgi:hypothetical protein